MTIQGKIFDKVKSLDKTSLLVFDMNRAEELFAKEGLGKYHQALANDAFANLQFISEFRRLAEPSLDVGSSMLTEPSFDKFWRALLYNRDGRLNIPTSENGVSFGYWYLLMKILAKHRVQSCKLISLHGVLRNLAMLSLLFCYSASTFGVGYRSFSISEQGRLGWIPRRAKPGDLLGVFATLRSPVVLRRLRNGYEFIGCCYIHDLMDWEPVDLPVC